MSNLQISLAIVGVVLLGLIVAYNSWNNRRNAPKRAQPSEAGAGGNPEARFDPGLDGVDVTSLSNAPAIDPLLNVSAGELAEPAPAPASSEETLLVEPAPAARPPVERDKMALDGLIDAIAPIKLDHLVPGDAALQVQPTTRRAGSKPFRIEGLNAATGDWESLRAGQRYSQFQAGVQLANRLGALNEIEFSEFVSKVQGFADSLNAAPELPDMLHEVARGRELDQFASEHDAQLSFMLRPRRAAWSPGYIQQHAANLGFVPSNMPGRMLLPSSQPGHAPLLMLAYDAQAAQADNLDQTAIHEIWLSLDVAQVPRSEQPFARLREIEQTMCQSMEGVLCDQNGHQLLPQVLDPIEADLEKLYDKLDSRELSAGSALARRLFN